jgi:uncharacterized protein (TIGR02391 family)
MERGGEVPRYLPAVPFMAKYIPPLEQVLDLPLDELDLRILRLAEEQQQGHLMNRHSIGLSGSWQDYGPDASRPEFLHAIVEAWDWLEHHGIVARNPDDSGGSYITRFGRRFLNETNAPALLKAEARLDVDLHPRVARKARRQFLLGEYELAALAAMKEVEIRVRELAQEPESAIGVKLMQETLKHEGVLADPQLDAAEQQATMALFLGAIGVFKNPSSHREVEYDDPTFAAEVVMLADLLLRMLDRIEARPTPLQRGP